MSLINLKINNIPGREFILSPTVKNGSDIECSPKDFYQYSKKIIYLGCLGPAMKIKHRKTGIIYSLVSFEKEKIFKLNYQEKINSTLDLMYKATHSYMFRLLNNYETENHLGLIFESFEGDSLDNLILKGKCDIQTSLKYLVEVIFGIIHMNDLGLYNLNIRPEYILVDECINITDYNLKMKDKPDMPKRAKDLLNINNQNNFIDIYYSPEEINSIKNGKTLTNLNSKLDSWKCGMLLFEMLTKFKWPFIINNNVDINMINFDNKVSDAILNSEVDLSLITDSFCRDLISKLLKKNPEERIDIKDIINIDIIKGINIEQKEINVNDNIINPIDEEDKEENKTDEIDINDKDSLIKQLRSENELLKRKLSQEKNESNSVHFIDAIKPLILGNTNSNKKEKEISKENKDKDKDKNKNAQEIVENKINSNLDQKINNENFSEKDLEDKSSSNDNNIDIDSNNNENILENYKKLKEKYKLKEQEVKNLKEELSKIKKEKEISEQKSLNDFEKMNISKITNISELSNFVFNSLKIFGESQKNMESLIEKLISVSGKEHNSLMEESKKFIKNKTKNFFETIDKIVADEKKNEIKENNEEEKKKNNIIKENEFYEMKKNYELIKQNEEKMKEKIKILEEKNNALELLNKNLMRTIDDMYVHYKGDDTIKKNN